MSVLLASGTKTAAAPGDVIATLRPVLDLRADEYVGATAVDAQGRRMLAINRTVEPFLIRSARVVRLLANGAVDTAFVAPAFDDHLHVILPAGEETLYVGGRFLTAGNELLAGVVRLKSDGRIDREFQPAAPFGLRYVHALSTDARGDVLVGGWFNQWEGRPVAEFVKLRADGSLDLAFMTNAPAPDPSSRTGVMKVEALPDGRVALLGAGLSVLEPEGRLAFRLGSGRAISAWSASPEGGWILVENLQTSGFPFRLRLSRWDAAGAEDVAWRREYATDGSATQLIRGAEGGYWLAGVFSSLGGQRHEGVVRLAEDGSLDAGWVARLSDPSLLDRHDWERWGLPLRVDAVRELAAGGLEVVGHFEERDRSFGWKALTLEGGRVTGGVPLIGGAATEVVIREGERVRLGIPVASALPFRSVWTRDGAAVERGQDPVIEFIEVRLAEAGEYRCVVSNALGMSTSAPIRLRVEWGDTAPGSRDPGFRAVAMSPEPERMRPFTRVDGLEATGGGIYVASEAVWALNPAESVPVAHGSPRLARLVAEGAADPAFVMMRGAPEAARLKAVNRILPLRDGRVLADVELSAVAPEVLSVRRLVMVRADGAMESGFEAALTRKTPFTRVSAMLEMPDGGILVAGLFEGTSAQESWVVVKLRVDGTRDTEFRPVVGTANATALAMQSEGRWLADLVGVGVRRFLADGTPDPSFRPALEPQVGVRLMAVDRVGRVLVSVALGDPTQIEPERLVRLMPDGELDGSFSGFERRGDGVSVGIHRVVEQADGRLVVVLNGILGSGSPVIRLNGNGTMDESFAMLPGTGAVTDLTVTPEGRILVSRTQFVEGYGFGTVLVALNGTDERRLDLVRQADGRLEGRVSTRAGRRYEVERSAASVGAPWVPVVAFDGDGRDRTFTEPADGSAAYYRVRLSVP